MNPILPLAVAGALVAGCTLTSTFENPNCERYPYLDACQGSDVSAAPAEAPTPEPAPGLGNPGNARSVGRAGEDPPGRGGMSSPDQGGPGTRGASDGHAGKKG